MIDQYEARLAELTAERDTAYQHGWDDGFATGEKSGNLRAATLRIERDILRLALEQRLGIKSASD